MTATVGRVSPNPKRTLTDEDAERIRLAKLAHESSYEELKGAVRTASKNGAGIRPLAEATDMSTNTISRWLNEPKRAAVEELAS